MKRCEDASSLVSGILNIIHPSQYAMGWHIHNQLITKQICSKDILAWPSMFSALSIISNRSTPFHRDDQGGVAWYDILTSIGQYVKAPLYLSPFAFRIDNCPGTLCAFSGMSLRHGVRKCKESRISFAWYMREKIRVGEGIPAAGWMRQGWYSEVVGSSAYGLRSSCLS